MKEKESLSYAKFKDSSFFYTRFLPTPVYQPDEKMVAKQLHVLDKKGN